MITQKRPRRNQQTSDYNGIAYRAVTRHQKRMLKKETKQRKLYEPQIQSEIDALLIEYMDCSFASRCLQNIYELSVDIYDLRDVNEGIQNVKTIMSKNDALKKAFKLFMLEVYIQTDRANSDNILNIGISKEITQRLLGEYPKLNTLFHRFNVELVKHDINYAKVNYRSPKFSLYNKRAIKRLTKPSAASSLQVQGFERIFAGHSPPNHKRRYTGPQPNSEP
jgi:hypothetical protein